jgi:hypothetical protein
MPDIVAHLVRRLPRAGERNHWLARAFTAMAEAISSPSGACYSDPILFLVANRELRTSNMQTFTRQDVARRRVSGDDCDGYTLLDTSLARPDC